MRPALYVDTGFWIALMDAKDSHHDHAKKAFNTLFSHHEIVTAEVVVGETVTYLNCSLKRHDLAIAFLDQTDVAPVRVLMADSDTRTDARAILRKYGDQALSYADCISFALMKQHGIDRFAGYDKHFAMLGFQPS